MDDGFAVIYWACRRVIITQAFLLTSPALLEFFGILTQWTGFDLLSGRARWGYLSVRPRVIPDGCW